MTIWHPARNIPPTDGLYIVAIRYYFKPKIVYWQHKTWWVSMGNPVKGTVTHWTPAPKLPPDMYGEARG